MPARLTRTGVFLYRNADGTERRELRLPEEVFAPPALASLAGAPVTVGHQGFVTPENYKALAVGHVGDNVKPSGEYAEAKVYVGDGAALKAVQAKDLVEVSCGYECILEPTPGEHAGQKYDGIQRSIRYNHVALGHKDWGRAGNNVRLLTDSAYCSDMDEQITARVDALTAENAKLQARVDALTADAKAFDNLLQEAVQTRLDLVDAARSVLADLDPKGKKDRDIYLSVIAHTDGAFKPEGKSDEYLKARFDFLVEQAGKAKAAQVRETPAPGPDPVAAARAKMIERNAWKGVS